MDVVKKMEQLGTADGRPDGIVKIIDCGEMSDAKTQNLIVADKGIELVRWRKLFSAYISN